MGLMQVMSTTDESTTKVGINVRMEPEMHAALKSMAVKNGRSLHNMIVFILRSAIEDNEQGERT